MKKDDRGNLLIGAIGALKLFLNVLVIQLLSKYYEWVLVPLLIPVLLIAFLLEGPILYMSDLTALFLMPAPPVPEITYAEFPFEIVYEADGDIYEINDSLVCEYAGIGISERTIISNVRKYLNWNAYVKGTGNDRYITLKELDDGAILCLYLGDIDYYMFGKVTDYSHLPGEIAYFGSSHYHEFLEDFDEEEYDIKIISTKFSEPLEENKCEYRTIDKTRMFILSYINRELMLC